MICRSSARLRQLRPGEVVTLMRVTGWLLVLVITKRQNSYPASTAEPKLSLLPAATSDDVDTGLLSLPAFLSPVCTISYLSKSVSVYSNLIMARECGRQKFLICHHLPSRQALTAWNLICSKSLTSIQSEPVTVVGFEDGQWPREGHSILKVSRAFHENQDDRSPCHDGRCLSKQ